MREPEPIIVIDLFPEVLKALLEFLSSLSAEEWGRPTACGSWSVGDVALHLLGGDVGILSRKRDGHSLAAPVGDWEELVAWINERNEEWVRATRRMSPRLLCDLLEHLGAQVCEYFASLDPHQIGEPVSWAGPDPAPVWLDLARECTERWHHQQHIRDAVGRPGLKGPRFLAPVLDAFVRALPWAYHETDAADGTLVALTVSGASGGRWFLLRQGEGWRLYLDVARRPDAEVVVDEDTAWRLFTRGLTEAKAQSCVMITGDQRLGARMLDVVSILA